jgi:hypothetical protein
VLVYSLTSRNARDSRLRGEATPPRAVDSTPISEVAADDPAPESAPGSQPIEPAKPAVADAKAAEVIDRAVFGKFDDWAQRYLAAPEGEREALLVEGLQLAQARRIALGGLIAAAPREALDRAVPMTVRQDLPEEVVALLEERVNERAFFGVLGVVGGQQPIRRHVKTESKNYEAYVFGRREGQATTERAFVNGIAVDKRIAVDERPIRVLESGERVPANKRVVEKCLVSGKETKITRTAEQEAVPIDETTPAIEVGGTVHYLCSGGHIAAAEEGFIAQEGSTGGATKPTGNVPTTSNTGIRTHLYMRVTFPDQMQDPQNEANCYDMMRQVDDFMRENSFGKCYFVTTVTPLLVLPRTEAWYKVDDNDLAVLNDARAAAKAAGYDPSAYDFDTVRYSGGPGSFGGQAYVGGKGCWMKSSSAGVAAHEYGHNLGLWHANYWNTSPASVIGPGTNSEYGNSFDTMGAASAGNNHFGAYNKSVINWMTPEIVATVRESGTYRIYQHDQAIADPAKRYGLRVAKDNDRDYWAEFRQKFTTNNWLMNGLQLTWDRWGAGGDSSANGSNSGPQLLDVTPGSPDGKNDSSLIIGRTFSDHEAGVHITPIGKGGTTPQSMDVIVNLGSFPGNSAPTLSIAPSATAVAASTTVSFNATAEDVDGDVLAYAWDFGDKTFSTTNSASVTKSWSAAGQYLVRCTASDMKGGITTRQVVIAVGTVSTFSISGTVVNPTGQPMEGVLVSNGQTGTAFRGTYTDSSGNYVVTNLAAGSHSISAQQFGFNFTPGFSNPVAVGPSQSARNFSSTATPTLSIVAFDASAREGTDPGRFRITRTGSTASAKVIRVVNPSGTATRGTDYTLSPDPAFNSTPGAYELTIPAGAAFLDVVLTTTNDTTQEGPETAVLQLVPITGMNITGPAHATITIDDDDTVLPRVRITANDDYASEGADPAQFTISRTGSTASSLSVNLTVSGTATNGADYTTIGNVTIPAGSAATLVNVMPIDDSLVEGNETVTVTIANIASYVRDASATAATATINDNDVNILTVAATDSTASESGDTAIFTITRTGNLASALTVDYVIGGTALHGTDYLRLPGVATIPAGQASTAITIVPIDDSIGEATQTVVIQLRSKTTYQVGAPALASANLTDNDGPAIWIVPDNGISTEPATGVGTDTARIRIYRAGGSSAFTVNYTISGTAAPGIDYSSIPSSVSFAAADTFKEIVITPLGDSLQEGTETVTLTLTPAAAYTVEPESSASVLIIDEDAPTVSVSNENTTVSETSTAIRFWFSRSGSTTAALTVNYTMSGTATPGVDYTGATGTVVIPAAAAGVYLTLVPVNDTIPEGAESITASVVAVAGSYVRGVPTATYFLGDNDNTGLPQVRFAAASSGGAEGVGTVNIPVTLSAASTGSVTVNYAVTGGSATAGGVDYDITNGSLVFAPGETSKMISFALVDDIRPEGNETVVIGLSGQNGATLGTASHTYTIADNDPLPVPTVSFVTTGSSVQETEAAPQVLLVALSTASTSPVSVNYSVTGGTATSPSDFSLPAGTLTFAAGEVAKYVPISIVADGVAESNETVVVALSNPVGASVGSNGQHTLTIEGVAATVTVTVSDSTAGEPNSTGSFTLTRAGSTTGPLSVSVSLSGSAVNGVDYQSIPSVVNFAAAQSSVVVTVVPLNDTLPEGNETVILTVNAAATYSVGTPAAGSLTLADDDQNAAPSFTKGLNVTVPEDVSAQTFVNWATAISAGPGEGGQSVTFTVSNDNPTLFTAAPAVSPTGTLTFTPSPNAFGVATVSVQARDNGGTANGGVDVSAVQTFTITVSQVNDAPSFVKGPEVTVDEDSGPQTVPAWATAMSPGAANESGQAVSFVAVATEPAFFSGQPQVSANGTLTFTTAPSASGSTIVSVAAKDDGGTASGGVDTSTAQTFTIIVRPVNDAPTLQAIADITIPEGSDTRSIALTGISTGAANESDALTITAVSDNPSLIPNPTVEYLSPGATGSLAVKPAANRNGSAMVTVVVSDGQALNATVTRSFTINVSPVNNAPAFTAGPVQTVKEDAGAQSVAWASEISVGPEDEAAQKPEFVVTVDKEALFEVLPAVDASGNLTYTPAADANGVAIVKVKLRDDGGTENGGVDTSEESSLTITIDPVNDVPSFARGANVDAKQNAGAQLVAAWATDLRPGPPNEAEQTLEFIVSTDRPELFTAVPAIDPTGALSYTPSALNNGMATVSVRLRDSGGSADGGVDTSAEQTFTITTLPVNDAPSFVVGADLSVPQDAGAQTVPGWATAIISGPADESAQAVQFVVTVDDPALFAVAPAIAPDGTLTFTPLATASGKAIVTVRLQDDGGTTDGGIDISEEQTFSIAVTTFDEETGTYNGLVRASEGTTVTNEQFGVIRVVVRPKGAFSGYVKAAGRTHTFKGSFDKAGVARFEKSKSPELVLKRKGLPELSLALNLDVSEGFDQMTGVLEQGGDVVANLLADRALFTSKASPVAPLRNVPAELLGKYNVVIGARTPDEQGMPSTSYPQGDGVAVVTVSKKGVAKLKGTLADGSKISMSAPLAKDLRWPFHVALHGGKGSITSAVTFRKQEGVSDLDGMGAVWIKPGVERAKRYSEGWPNGIHADLLGAKYVPLSSQSALGELLPEDADGNVELVIAGPDVPAAPIKVPLNMSPASKATPVSSTSGVVIAVEHETGAVSGSFVHPETGKNVKFHGIVLPSQSMAAGFFLGESGSGSVELVPMQAAEPPPEEEPPVPTE